MGEVIVRILSPVLTSSQPQGSSVDPEDDWPSVGDVTRVFSLKRDLLWEGRLLSIISSFVLFNFFFKFEVFLERKRFIRDFVWMFNNTRLFIFPAIVILVKNV